MSLLLVRRITTDIRRRLLKNVFAPKYLLYTNVTISLTLSGLGDVIQQRYEILTKNQEHWDVRRTRNMSVSGMTIGFMCHYFYKVLDAKLPGRTLKIALKKLMFDQFIGSPLCIVTFFCTLNVLENRSFDDFIDVMTNKAWKLYAADWIVWPPAQLFNFYFLPPRFRVLYDNTISLGYDIYASYVANTTGHKKDDANS